MDASVAAAWDAYPEPGVRDELGRVHRITRDGGEYLRETSFTDELGEAVVTTFGATDTEVVFWNAVVALRGALREATRYPVPVPFDPEPVPGDPSV